MIDSLKWDSELFGYPVGRFTYKSPQWFSADESSGYDLIYVFSDIPITESLFNLQLKDIKTLLSKKIQSKIFADFSLLDRKILSTDFGNITKLAFESGIYSRFKIDPNFKKDEFESLYRKWIEGSINKSNADELIVYREPDTATVKGFITLKYFEDHAQIGLIAVSEDQRGKGVGSLLIQYACNLTFENSIFQMNVVTQFSNKPAMQLYEKSGFKIKQQTFIYHWWKHLQEIQLNDSF